MERPIDPSYGGVKQNVDGCLFVWTGKKKDCSERFTRHVIV